MTMELFSALGYTFLASFGFGFALGCEVYIDIPGAIGP